MTRSSFVFQLSGALCAGLLCLPLAAGAVTLDTIQQQLDQGHNKQALAGSNRFLQAHPGDRNAQFARGLAQARLGDTDAAIETFGALARANPKLPEPANNLAVLYARKGQYDKARRWLEAAMATSPAYDTAHKNLGDVYTALAAVAYSKALDQSGKPSDLGVDLSMVNKLYEPAEQPTQVASSNQSGKQQSRQSKLAREKPTGQTPEPGKPQVVRAPKPTPEPLHPPRQETKAGQQGGQQAQASNQPKPVNAAEIMPAVRAWAKAWSDQNIQAYLDAYADNFYPGDGLTLSQWRGLRRDRVSSPKYIKIDIEQPKVKVLDDGRAQVGFKQVYTSDTYSDKVHKTLTLESTANGWKIVREDSDPL